jgi:hypothetical protein
MIKKIYLSRAQTRAMAAEHPIGDPTGGPAYGEKNDPISAAISIGTMFATAEAGFAAMTLMQGITFAGAAVSLVGNITGNKSLMKLGAIAGIAGGLGSFAESQGLFSSGNLSETLGMGAKETTSALNATPAPGTQTPVADGVQVTPVPDAAQSRSLTGAGGPDITTTTQRELAAASGADVNVAGGGTRSLNVGPAVDPLNPGLAPGKDILGRNIPQMSYAQGSGPNLSTAAAPAPGFVDSLKAGNYLDAAKAAGSGTMDMLKNNPTGAYVAAQAIGGVADWLSGKTDAEIAALKANTGFADAKAQEVQLAIAKEERRRLNMANRYATTSPQTGIAVNPNAVVRPPATTGLVAGNMQTRPA